MENNTVKVFVIEGLKTKNYLKPVYQILLKDNENWLYCDRNLFDNVKIGDAVEGEIVNNNYFISY